MPPAGTTILNKCLGRLAASQIAAINARASHARHGRGHTFPLPRQHSNLQQVDRGSVFRPMAYEKLL
jgi:hypothetical protein